MNKIIILLLLIFISPISLYAQEEKPGIMPKHNIYGGYGLGTVPDIRSMGESIGTAIASLGFVRIKDEKYSGSFFIGYTHNLTELFAVDLKAGYQSYKSDIYSSSNNKIGSQNDNYYVFIAGANFQYSNKNYLRTYSGIDFGLFIDERKETYNGKVSESSINHLGFQITLFGLRAGGNIGGFIELGFGYMGILSAGVSAMF